MTLNFYNYIRCFFRRKKPETIIALYSNQIFSKLNSRNSVLIVKIFSLTIRYRQKKIFSKNLRITQRVFKIFKIR